MLELREHAIHHGFWDPTFGGVRGFNRAVLREEIDLVIAHANNLPVYARGRL